MEKDGEQTILLVEAKEDMDGCEILISIRQL